MPVTTRINAQYLTDVVGDLRITLNHLNERAGLGANYIYRLTGTQADKINVSLRTIDLLHNAIEQRMLELRIPPPDDLWDRLVVHDPE